MHVKGGPVREHGESVLVGPGLVAVQEDGHLGPRLPGPESRPGDLLSAVHAGQTLPGVFILYARRATGVKFNRCKCLIKLVWSQQIRASEGAGSKQNNCWKVKYRQIHYITIATCA